MPLRPRRHACAPGTRLSEAASDPHHLQAHSHRISTRLERREERETALQSELPVRSLSAFDPPCNHTDRCERHQFSRRQRCSGHRQGCSGGTAAGAAPGYSPKRSSRMQHQQPTRPTRWPSRERSLDDELCGMLLGRSW